jgi:protease II
VADPAEYIPSRCAYKHENDCWSVILHACSEQEIVAIKESGNTEQEWRVMFNEPTNARSSSESEAKSEITQLKVSVDQALLVLNEAKEIGIKTPEVDDSQVRIRDPEKQMIYTESYLRLEDRVIEAKKQKAIAEIEVDAAITKRRKTMELSDEQDSLFQTGNESYDTLLDFATARELLIESRLKSA